MVRASVGDGARSSVEGREATLVFTRSASSNLEMTAFVADAAVVATSGWADHVLLG